VDKQVRQFVVRVLLASDQALFREGLKKLLDGSRRFFVVAEAADSGAALRSIGELQPHVLLLDWEMGRATCLLLLRQLAATPFAQSVRVLIVNGPLDASDAQIALELGARGFVLKQSSGFVLQRALRSVVSGQYWVGREGRASLADAMRRLDGGRGAQSPKPFGLTDREFEIMGAVAAAYPNKDIAAQLSISEKTVKHHLTNIFDKVGVSSRLELALFALRHLAGLSERAIPPVPPRARAN
jgi:DNA-binding NarL/FixJ family response regulator